MLDAQDQTFTYVNAGHNPPVLLRNNGNILLQEGGPILGVLEGASYRAEEAQLLPGDVVLLYTDGITEAEQSGEYFGEERLLELVQAHLFRSPEEIVETILKTVAEFSADSPQTDDRTIIVLKREK
jgi:sigma-B regulation protein RsbU (phosphoserine phosphatase)